ncbi:hypothetical protein V7S43_014821 [Phytophthora oleae]|uniref:Uncharacterized protein n=1 Tax=Phytophthora oleae TaxID=2107226 RepID=A0ABD3F2T6_9STRA
MGKSTDRNVTTEEEFFKLEQVLNQTADDTVNCLKLLKQHLSEYDSRNGNHFTHTASSFMRSDMRTAKDTAMDLKHVAHEINKNHKPSKTEIESSRNMRDATAKTMENLKVTARNYDRENGQRMGVKGTVDAAVGGRHDKEKHEQHGLLGGDKYKEKEDCGGLFGKEKETGGGFFGSNKDENDKQSGLFGKSKDEHEKQSGLLGKSDKDKDEHNRGFFGGNEKDEHHRSFFGGDDKNGGGIMGSSETVETIVKKILRDNFSLSALDQQITDAEKSLSPSIVERAKEKIHGVKEKIKGDKSEPAHGEPDEGHHHKHKVLP